jgi:hypothetical protein
MKLILSILLILGILVQTNCSHNLEEQEIKTEEQWLLEASDAISISWNAIEGASEYVIHYAITSKENSVNYYYGLFPFEYEGKTSINKCLKSTATISGEQIILYRIIPVINAEERWDKAFFIKDGDITKIIPEEGYFKSYVSGYFEEDEGYLVYIAWHPAENAKRYMIYQYFDSEYTPVASLDELYDLDNGYMYEYQTYYIGVSKSEYATLQFKVVPYINGEEQEEQAICMEVLVEPYSKISTLASCQANK